MGFLFVLRSTVLEERGTFERATDMLRKLREEQDVYDATCVLLAESNDAPFAGVTLRQDAVPGDLRTDAFMPALVDWMLERTPVDMYVEVRERREHRELPLEKDEGTGQERRNSRERRHHSR